MQSIGRKPTFWLILGGHVSISSPTHLFTNLKEKLNCQFFIFIIVRLIMRLNFNIFLLNIEKPIAKINELKGKIDLDQIKIVQRNNKNSHMETRAIKILYLKWNQFSIKTLKTSKKLLKITRMSVNDNLRISVYQWFFLLVLNILREFLKLF